MQLRVFGMNSKGKPRFARAFYKTEMGLCEIDRIFRKCLRYNWLEQAKNSSVVAWEMGYTMKSTSC